MRIKLYLLLASSALVAWGKLTPEEQGKLPLPASQPIHFEEDVKPILEASCMNCHGRGKEKGGFAIDNRQRFLEGGDSGPGAVPGKSAESLVVELVSGLNPETIMPQKGSKLTPEQVGILRRWIDDGVQWPENITFGKLPPKNLHPHKPDVPEVAGMEQPVDRFIWSYFAKHGLEAGEVVEDRVFARRAYLDLIGLLPTAEEMARFLADESPEKRRKLVRELLDREIDYAQHWLTFWNDALRNDYKGTGYIDGGRKQITGWLFGALVKNKPYDQFVAELINPTPESEGFAKGIVWRGVVNASQTPQMQAAQNISQVFMGVNLKCASCHDSFINDWTLGDAYGLASIYAEQELEMFQCDAPTGKTAEMRFIYPELGAIDAKLDQKERLAQLAEIVTSEKNGRLTRTIVNRLWGRLMGRALIEPVDDMEKEAWHQDLLDWLAADLAENGYDLKGTIERIVTSRAYQLSAVPVEEIASEDFVFTGPLIRRMSAEQFVDAIAQLTGVWDRTPAAQVNFAALIGKRIDPSFGDQPVQPKWIWKDEEGARRTAPETIYFRKLVEIPEEPTEAGVVITCDNAFQLFVNGKEVGSSKDYTKPKYVDLQEHLRPGLNLIAVAAKNDPSNAGSKEVEQGNPAGLWVYGRVRHADQVMDFGTDASWIWSAKADAGWEKPPFAVANWQRAAELGGPEASPWKLGETLAQVTANSEFFSKVRASLVNNDPLMTALGRPNREQVVTSRASAATTLQALELTNGPTLAEQLKAAGQALTSEQLETELLVTKLYEAAFGRTPTSEELNLSRELVGSPARAEGVEDLLWAMTMLPEFQLIY